MLCPSPIELALFVEFLILVHPGALLLLGSSPLLSLVLLPSASTPLLCHAGVARGFLSAMLWLRLHVASLYLLVLLFFFFALTLGHHAGCRFYYFCFGCGTSS